MIHEDNHVHFKLVVELFRNAWHICDYFQRISSYKKLIKVTVWIFRFSKNSNLKSEQRKLTDLDLDDLKQEGKFDLRKIQKKESKENIKNMQTLRMLDGLISI